MQTSTESESPASYVHRLLGLMVKHQGSDLFITADFPPAIKVDGRLTPIHQQRLDAVQSMELVRAIMDARQLREFEIAREANFAIHVPQAGRFRVSAFIQQGKAGMVIRTIHTRIPSLEEMRLPNILAEVVMAKRGLVIVTGATGSGKSTTLAAMVNHRNVHSHGHIITIEDPIEYVHAHRNCIVTQREVGVDTESWQVALKNTLRQAPDVILLGEIRDHETMEYAMQYAETGHLCMGTLHANSANQAIDRILNFFPEEKRQQLLIDLSLNLRALISQRLLPRKGASGRVAAIEIMLGTPMVADLIFKGQIAALKDVIRASREQGMVTFDQALFELYESGQISYEDALRNADSLNDLRLQIKLRSKLPTEQPETDGQAVQLSVS